MKLETFSLCLFCFDFFLGFLFWSFLLFLFLAEDISLVPDWKRLISYGVKIRYVDLRMDLMTNVLNR